MYPGGVNVVLAALALAFNQPLIVQETPVKGEKRMDAAMEKWRDNRFGTFIHLGLYSALGGSYKGKVVDAAEWIQASAGIPDAEYGKLKSEFTLKSFDARAWARQFKNAGSKYVVITSKHHDGFCLWDSEFTNFDLAETPAARKDILRTLGESVRREGMDYGIYYSIIDWNHPDYRAELKTEEDKVAYRRYLDFMKLQLKELLTKFGPVKVLWFDGRWDPSYKQNPAYGIEIEAWCREIAPGIVINDRVRAYDSIADYDASYERRLPKDDLPDIDWEACMTMPEMTWGYHEHPTGNGWKSPQTLLEMLLKCSSKNGNFLLNIGPRADGAIRDEELARQTLVGAWLKKYGEAIYGTRGLKLATSSPCFATRKGDSVYLTFTHWPETNAVQVDDLPNWIRKAELLTERGPVELEVTRGRVILPMTPADPMASVVRITLGN